MSASLEREKLEALAEFAAGAGHEINNPLAVISGRAQLLLRDETDPERRRDLAIIHAQALRIHEMISDLMLFARPPRPECRPCNAAAIVAAAVAALQPKAELLGVRLKVDATAPVDVVTDAEQVQVALRAIIDNALNLPTKAGCVEVALRRADNGVEFEIRDHGPGISDEVRRHLFDPFYSGREAGRGLGMGLSKAWRIATNLSGTIDVESPAEGGAIFRMRLPYNGSKHDSPEGSTAMNDYLTIEGEVDRPLRLSFDNLAQLPAEFQISDVSRLDSKRSGDAVRLEGLLQHAGVRPSARWLTLHSGVDDFHASIPLEAVRERGIVIYRLDHAPLPPKSGGPFRFFIPDFAACHTHEVDECANVKFVDRMELSSDRGRDNRPHDGDEHEALHKRQE